jgi:hypothetical protein
MLGRSGQRKSGGSTHILLLTDVGQERHDRIAFILEPCEDGAGIQPAAIGKTDGSLGHDCRLLEGEIDGQLEKQLRNLKSCAIPGSEVFVQLRDK